MTYDPIKIRDELVKQKLLRCDDLCDLRVYSYTNSCKTWNDITLNSRGIIYNRETGEVVARPFPKFFNMGQREETQEHNLPWKDGFRIFRKEDGWLGILYRVDGQHRIATKGSFKSIGAKWATEYLKKYDLTELPDDVTLLFELICPATHIVVDYGTREDLVLLAAYNRHTGKEYEWEQVEKWSKQFDFTLVESYDKVWLGHCRGQIKTVPGNKLEGFVIKFNDLRVKIKSEDYFRRSHLIANLNPLGVWNMMVNGKVDRVAWRIVDQDYHGLLNDLSGVLEKKYEQISLEIDQQFGQIGNYEDRAVFAKIVCKMSHRTALFAILDALLKYGETPAQRVDEYIMKQIRPHNNII